MAHNHIGNSPRVETQYATLFYLIDIAETEEIEVYDFILKYNNF